MADETNQPAGDGKPAEGLRNVPGDIVEYTKFVKEGGLDHNEKVLTHDDSVAAAQAAGILPADSETAEHEAQEKKHRNGFQQRVTRLQRKIGERDQIIRDLQQRIAAPSGAPAPKAAEPHRETRAEETPAPAADKQHVNGKAAEAPPRPKEADFKTYGEFIEALTDWKTDRKLEAADQRRAQEARERTEADKGNAITDAHNTRVDEAKTRYQGADDKPAWDAAFKGLDDNSFSGPMVVFIFESEAGPDITYYLATNREELARIRALTPIRQAAELGRIEAKFLEGAKARGEKDGGKDDEKEPDEDAEEESAKPPEKPKLRVSKAPPPEKPIGGRAGAEDAPPDPKDFVAYEKWSKRQAAKGVKR